MLERAATTALATNREGLPTLFTSTPAPARRTLEFYTANIRNPNTRKAYARAIGQFAARCELNGLQEFGAIEPVHVAQSSEPTFPRVTTSPDIATTIGPFIPPLPTL